MMYIRPTRTLPLVCHYYRHVSHCFDHIWSLRSLSLPTYRIHLTPLTFRMSSTEMGPGLPGPFNATSIIVAVCIALTLYNAIELLVLIFATFKRWSGLYFWSLLVASFGLIPYSIGNLISFFELTYSVAGIIVSTLGWYCMVTGQSVVLYSRLHLVLLNRKVLRCVLWMIIINAIIFHIPTTVIHFGSIYSSKSQEFNAVYNVYEKIQMTGFVSSFSSLMLFQQPTAKSLLVRPFRSLLYRAST